MPDWNHIASVDTLLIKISNDILFNPTQQSSETMMRVLVSLAEGERYFSTQQLLGLDRQRFNWLVELSNGDFPLHKRSVIEMIVQEVLAQLPGLAIKLGKLNIQESRS